MKIRNNKKYLIIFCAPKIEDFCGFQSFKFKEDKIKFKNPRVVIYSVIALGFIVLGFLVSYWFIIGAIVLMILNQRELMKKNK
jgi:hypothetical protein